MPGTVRRIPVKSVTGEEDAFQDETLEESNEEEFAFSLDTEDCTNALDEEKIQRELEENGKEDEDEDGEDGEEEEDPQNENGMGKTKEKVRKKSRKNKTSIADMFMASSQSNTCTSSPSPLREDEDQVNKAEDEEDEEEAKNSPEVRKKSKVEKKKESENGDHEDKNDASGESSTENAARRKKWKSFTDGMKKYKAAMKKKFSRPKRDKNGVEEISIKPSRTLHENEADECWTTEVTVVGSTSEKKSKRSKSQASKSADAGRTGSAGSGSSEDACIEVMDFNDDGIETIYDAENDEISK